METVIVLPNQLFEINKLINNKSKVFLYEHPAFFTMYKYHKMKLVLHRASMKYYNDYLNKKYNSDTKYITFNENFEDILKDYVGKRIDIYDPIDYPVMTNLKKLAKKYNIKLFVHNTPAFTETMEDLNKYIEAGEQYKESSFYIWQRKRLNILIDADKKPIGGKWMFDSGNTLDHSPVFHMDTHFKLSNKSKNQYVELAIDYINTNFPNNPGNPNLYLPIDHIGTKKHFTKFINERLNSYGSYKDVTDENIIFGCHSVMSPLMNIGLITPDYAINEILNYYETNKKSVPLASVESYIRQIIGCRSFSRLIYMFKHKEMIEGNHFNHNRKLNENWYTGDTGITPIDNVIKKTLHYGYTTQMERLMYLSNFMLLNEISPEQVHNWFMSSFLDAYHVFIETNVYCLGQYSTGPLIVNRPYFSSSKYIDKTSTYKRNDNYPKIKINKKQYEWYDIWDSLYYNFIENHYNEFIKNYSTSSAAYKWKSKSNDNKQKILSLAKEYLNYN